MMSREQTRRDALAALAASIAAVALNAAACRRLLLRIDAARKVERITALEARDLRASVNGHSRQGRDQR